MNIVLSTGPSTADPTDSCPITVLGFKDYPIRFARVGWSIGIALWFIRRYVNKALSSGE